MSHLDLELQILKRDVTDMWKLVQSQLEKGKEALQTNNKDLAREVILKEKRVNAYELKIDRDCENIFALFNPVAVDLRFVLAVLKINNNLERTGDIADSIAKFVLDIDDSLETKLMESAKIIAMFEVANSMLADVEKAFDTEDTNLARTVFKKDDFLDEINGTASYVIADYIQANPSNIRQSLHILSIIRKLERIGDQSKNIAEEIIFFVEAKVLKHRSKQ